MVAEVWVCVWAVMGFVGFGHGVAGVRVVFGVHFGRRRCCWWSDARDRYVVGRKLLKEEVMVCSKSKHCVVHPCVLACHGEKY